MQCLHELVNQERAPNTQDCNLICLYQVTWSLPCTANSAGLIPTLIFHTNEAESEDRDCHSHSAGHPLAPSSSQTPKQKSTDNWPSDEEGYKHSLIATSPPVNPALARTALTLFLAGSAALNIAVITVGRIPEKLGSDITGTNRAAPPGCKTLKVGWSNVMFEFKEISLMRSLMADKVRFAPGGRVVTAISETVMVMFASSCLASRTSVTFPRSGSVPLRSVVMFRSR